MALIKCPGCGQEVSDKAKKCIHCGKALKDESAVSEKIKCSNCGKLISDDEHLVWKCTSCEKAFKVSLSKLKKMYLQKNKPEYAGKMLLKCPTCGNWMDDGNEKIAYKCPACENVMTGNLKYFAEEKKAVNNTILCLECGKEISDDVKECPNCGCPVEASKEQKIMAFVDKKSKEKRKVLNKRLLFVSVALITLMLFVTIFFIRSENKKQNELLMDASAFNDEIAELKKRGLPTTYELQDMMVRYNLLNAEQKALITNYSDILAFSQLNIDGINKVQKQIDDQLKSETKKYKNVIEIKADYDKLSIEEQKYIHDIDELLKYVELSNADKAALVSVKNIRSVLKNQESLQIEKINVKDNTANGGSYYVVISYSAQNGFGGNKSSTSCFAISSEFVDPFWTLALLSDINKYLNENLNLYSLYLECEEEDQHIDVDKIMANLDTEIVVE